MRSRSVMMRRENRLPPVVVYRQANQQRSWEAIQLASKESVKMNKRTTKGKSSKPHGLPLLRNLRQRKGLSLGQLADLTGIRRDTISHLEDGRVDPQPYHVRK